MLRHNNSYLSFIRIGVPFENASLVALNAQGSVRQCFAHKTAHTRRPTVLNTGTVISPLVSFNGSKNSQIFEHTTNSKALKNGRSPSNCYPPEHLCNISWLGERDHVRRLITRVYIKHRNPTKPSLTIWTISKFTLHHITSLKQNTLSVCKNKYFFNNKAVFQSMFSI